MTNENKVPTEKQMQRLRRMEKALGVARIKEYMLKHKMPTTLEALTRKQAQKIIIGLDPYMPRKPIPGIAFCRYWMEDET